MLSRASARVQRGNIPDLGHDENVLSLDNALLDGPRQALPDLGLVAVAVRAVEQAVADLERVVDALGDDTRGRLPCACREGKDEEVSCFVFLLYRPE